jgi:hypothetical protein
MGAPWVPRNMKGKKTEWANKPLKSNLLGQSILFALLKFLDPRQDLHAHRRQKFLIHVILKEKSQGPPKINKGI